MSGPWGGGSWTPDDANSVHFGIARPLDWPEIDETHRWASDLARRYVAEITAAREREARRLIERKLRPRLRWLVNYPRLLGWVYRVLPSWRPVMYRRIDTFTTANLKGREL